MSPHKCYLLLQRMHTRNIYTIGETLMDIIFRGNQPVASRAGGSVLNTSVSLGRLKLPVHLISEIGKDDIGKQVTNFLTENEVDTTYSYRFNKGATALALAFLNEQEEASYSFYKNYPSKRLQISLPDFKRNDILLFGSFYSISKAVRPTLLSILKSAKDAGAIIIYDPNFRKPHLKDLPRVADYIMENIEFADIVRGSKDDFQLMFKTNSVNETFSIISRTGDRTLIYSSGAGPVHLKTANRNLKLEVPQVTPVSTVGAGDSFNAGLIYSIYRLNISRQDLQNLRDIEWKVILDGGITFGSVVTKTIDNYIPENFAKKMLTPRSNGSSLL